MCRIFINSLSLKVTTHPQLILRESNIAVYFWGRLFYTSLCACNCTTGSNSVLEPASTWMWIIWNTMKKKNYLSNEDLSLPIQVSFFNWSRPFNWVQNFQISVCLRFSTRNSVFLSPKHTQYNLSEGEYIKIIIILIQFLGHTRQHRHTRNHTSSQCVWKP